MRLVDYPLLVFASRMLNAHGLLGTFLRAICCKSVKNCTVFPPEWIVEKQSCQAGQRVKGKHFASPGAPPSGGRAQLSSHDESR